MRRQILLGALAVAAVSLLTGLFATGLARRELVQEAQDELNRQAEATARILETEIRQSARINRAAVRRTLEQVRLIGGHDYLEAALVTANGLRPLNPDPVLLPQVGDAVTDDARRRLEVDGRPVLATVRTLGVGRFTFLVVIGREEPLLSARLLTGPLVAGLLIGALMAFGVAYVIAARLGRRVDDLVDASKAVAAGDYSTRVAVRGDDAVARLGQSFNDMADQLAASRARERDFLMSVGHDLRTPLTTIRGYAEGLDSGDIGPGDLPRVAAILHQQTDRLSRLVEDLMLLARLEANEFRLRTEPVDVAAHVTELVAAERGRADRLGVRLDVDLADVGKAEIDPDRLGQIVGNLLDNAFRYTPEGGSVAVRLRAQPGAFELEVADSGPGIDPEDIPHVFDRLYVAQRYRPLRPEGSGLGLSIVRALVHAMGGHVDVHSEPGKGTSVRVRLPSGAS